LSSENLDQFTCYQSVDGNRFLKKDQKKKNNNNKKDLEKEQNITIY